MKGITAVIAVILLLLLTVAIVGFAYTFLTRTVASTAGQLENQTSQQVNSGAKRLSIENIDVNNANVTLRNTGTVTILTSEIGVYVNTAFQSCTWTGNSVASGGFISCKWPAVSCPTGTIIRVTAPGSIDQSVC